MFVVVLSQVSSSAAAEMAVGSGFGTGPHPQPGDAASMPDSTAAAAAAAPPADSSFSAAAAPPSWLDRRCPPRLLPYAHLMRLDKPIGAP